jgi:hypothetical protein
MRASNLLGLAFVWAAVAVTVASFLVLGACGQEGTTGAVAEEAPAIRPNLPPVPNVPPPRHKIQFEDGTWSVYGLRKRIRQNIDEEVRVKAFVVKIYTPEPCPEGRTCPPSPMPHLWLGDDVGESSERRLLRLVGYAQSQQEMDDAREEATKNKNRQPDPDEEAAGLPPIIYDWQQGKQYIVKGRFARSSGTGFAYSEGLLEYQEHQCLDCPPPEED